MHIWTLLGLVALLVISVVVNEWLWGRYADWPSVRYLRQARVGSAVAMALCAAVVLAVGWCWYVTKA